MSTASIVRVSWCLTTTSRKTLSSYTISSEFSKLKLDELRLLTKVIALGNAPKGDERIACGDNVLLVESRKLHVEHCRRAITICFTVQNAGELVELPKELALDGHHEHFCGRWDYAAARLNGFRQPNRRLLPVRGAYLHDCFEGFLESSQCTFADKFLKFRMFRDVMV